MKAESIHHSSLAILPDGKGRIGGDFSHNGFCKQTGLEFEAATIGGFVVEGGVGDGFVETRFKFGEKCFAATICEPVTAKFFDEVFGFECAVVEKCNHDGIDDEGTEFFHKVEG